jgi:hypothetical protein
MSTVQKFKKGDYIIWDNILWIVLNTDNQMYELELVLPRQFTTRHGNGGYLDSSIIDETATKLSTYSDNIVEGRDQHDFFASNENSSLKGGKRKSKKNNRSSRVYIKKKEEDQE